jgi:hypothetical protein
MAVCMLHDGMYFEESLEGQLVDGSTLGTAQLKRGPLQQHGLEVETILSLHFSPLSMHPISVAA